MTRTDKKWIAGAAVLAVAWIGLSTIGMQSEKKSTKVAPHATFVAPSPKPAPDPSPSPSHPKPKPKPIPTTVIRPDGPMTGYSRDKFPHWDSNVRGDCNTREVVLERDALNYHVTEPGCHVDSGMWLSTYDGVRITDATALDIDHVVPLAEAWRSGASSWSTGQREAFANDLTRPQLRAVTAHSNRAKGDQDPADWLPDHGRCKYVRDWVTIKRYYHLSMNVQEAVAIENVLAHC